MFDNRNIAFKCTYNDGGKNENTVGFSGTCSDEIIDWNIKKKRSWCSNKGCDCRAYYDRKFKGSKPEYGCYESEILTNWTGYAGHTHYGEKGGHPRRIKDAQIGRIAIFTTLFPNEKEINRRIIGVFKIASIVDKSGESTEVIADKKLRIKLTPSEKIYFWDYHSNTNSPKDCRWGSGLYRYIYDTSIATMLDDIKKIKRNKVDEKIAKELFDNFCINAEITEVLDKAGARR